MGVSTGRSSRAASTSPTATPAATSTCEALLELNGFGIAFGERVVLSSIDLQVPDRGVLVILGPAGTGKSTLLRTLAGCNDANPSLRRWGEARYRGEPLEHTEPPALVAQSARLLMSSVLENLMSHLPERSTLTKPAQRELARRLLATAGLAPLGDRLDAPVRELPLWQQRQMAILRLCAGNPPLLCVDEPTVGLSADEASQVLDYLRAEGERRAVMVVLHNQLEARRLGGQSVLLAGGRVQEQGHTDAFFAAPQTTPAQDFVRSGSCALPAPDARQEDLDETVAPPPPLPPAARDYVPHSFGPRGFLWLKKGRLAGTPRPGVVHDLGYDLSALKRVGVTVLINLTEQAMSDAAIAEAGIESRWYPIDDMHAPELAQAVNICTEIDTRLARNEVLAVHCLAGLGRTGTVLAAYLIWEGHNALDALESVRRIEPRWVQSDRQVEFLQRFETHLNQHPEPGRRRKADDQTDPPEADPGRPPSP